jgi:hypothetical protein
MIKAVLDHLGVPHEDGFFAKDTDVAGIVYYANYLKFMERARSDMLRTAGIDHVHPHQLRHTLATQAINRGMRLEAIAALLGHRSLEMTLIYARITDRVVADEYAAVSEQVDALYGTAQLPAGAEGNQMARLRREAHARLLGNGLCTAPPSSTAAWSQPARPAPTSRPASSSAPLSSANATTPATATKPTEHSSSTSSSSASTRTPLDTDHPYNTDSVAVPDAGDQVPIAGSACVSDGLPARSVRCYPNDLGPRSVRAFGRAIASTAASRIA